MRAIAWVGVGLTVIGCVEVGDSGTGGSDGGGNPTGPSSTNSTTSGPGSSSSSSSGSGGEGAGIPNNAEAARYPLELVSPRAAGTMPSTDPGTPAMPSGHRIFKAYPGLPYNIRAVVIGGSYPYAFSLQNAPEGMTIDASTGEIAWASPAATATPTIVVRDGEGTELSSPWTITVGVAGFRFVDAAAGSDAASGTAEAPWQTLAGVYEHGAVGEIVYFRSGTYSTDGLPIDGPDTWARVEFDGDQLPVQWIAYPGETPTISNGYSGPSDTGQFLRLSGSETHPVYLDGFEITDAWDKGMQFGSGTDYPVFRRLSIHGVAEAINGSNSAGIMTIASYGDPTVYGAYQDSEFFDNAPGGIKQYSHRKVLWEDLVFRDSGVGPDLKSEVPRFEVRACSFQGMSGAMCGLFGNMNDGGPDAGESASGEIRYNLMLCGDAPNVYAQDVNQDSMAKQIDLYRNTFVGTVRVRNVDSEDGPFHFDKNIIVNSSDGIDHVTFENVEDPSRITFGENLTGLPGDGIVDADGELQGSYAAQLGIMGHRIP